MMLKPSPYYELLRDLHPELQRAVHYAVTRCRPAIAPRPYLCDWEEELYHEAAFAACLAHATYDSDRGCSLYQWGVRVVRQHLKRFCDSVWTLAKQECEFPRDEETDEEIEFEDPYALEAIIESVQVGEVRSVMEQLNAEQQAILNLYFGEGLSVRAIGESLGVSKSWVHNQLRSAVKTLRHLLLGNDASED